LENCTYIASMWAGSVRITDVAISSISVVYQFVTIGGQYRYHVTFEMGRMSAVCVLLE
jgi:acyl-[acyl carrier protein]--UDP-N-acetylglucosamine O-acyltransferase